MILLNLQYKSLFSRSMSSIVIGSFKHIYRNSPAVLTLRRTFALRPNCLAFCSKTFSLSRRLCSSSLKNNSTILPLHSMSSSNAIDDKPFVAILTSNRQPVSEAAKAFTNPINAIIKKGNESGIEMSFWSAWHDVTTVAQQIHHTQQQRLVDFVDEVRKQACLLKDDGAKAKIWAEDISWESLPLLGAELRECWNKTPNDSEALDEGWVNLNSFVARLTATSANRDNRDFSLYGIWSLRGALEDFEPKKKVPNKSLLQAASMWMIYAASRLRDQARERRSFDGKLAREGSTLAGKDWTGFSMERWEVWKERFNQARDNSEDESTKDLLSKAISSMTFV